MEQLSQNLSQAFNHDVIFNVGDGVIGGLFAWALINVMLNMILMAIVFVEKFWPSSTTPLTVIDYAQVNTLFIVSALALGFVLGGFAGGPF